MFKEIVEDAWGTTDNGPRVILKAPLDHVVPRWAKKEL